MKKAAICLVETPAAAQAIVDRLGKVGFPATDISVLMPHPAGHVAPQAPPEAPHPFGTPPGVLDVQKETFVEEGAVTGGTAGGIIGALMGLVVGIGIGVPGLSIIFGGGPVMGTIAGALVGGAIGTISGAFMGMGIKKHEAPATQHQIGEGEILIAVDVDDRVKRDRAQGVFQQSLNEGFSTMTAEFA